MRSSQERHESCEAEWCIQEHTAQREVVAEIKNKVQTLKNSLEVTNSSIKQTQMTSVNGYRGDECQNHAYAEKTKLRESNIETGAQSEIDRRTRRRAKHRHENETNKAKIETFLGFGEAMIYSEKDPHGGKAQGQVSTKHIMKKCKTVNHVDTGTLSGTQISSRRSSRTTSARLHRACTVERLNTNIEELTKQNIADLFTKH